MNGILLALCALLVLASPVGAADSGAEPPDKCDYALSPATGSYLRIDRQSGAVSLCAERGGLWSCQLLADDRQTYQDRIAALEADKAALEAENTRLRTRIAALEGGGNKDAEARKREEFLDLSDKMMRHFFELIEKLKKSEDKPI